MEKKRKFHVVDAPAGSGKTFQAIRWALTQAGTENQKTVIVFKSIELLEQAQADARASSDKAGLRVKITAIHSNLVGQHGTDQSVGAKLQAHLGAATPKTGELLLITESAFISLLHWPNRWMWCCICDEVSAIAPAPKTNIPDNHHLLTQHVQLSGTGGKYAEVIPTETGRAALTRYAENPRRDQVNAVLSDMAKYIASPYFKAYVRVEQFQRLVNGSGEPGARQLEMFALLQETLFGSNATRRFCDAYGAETQVVDAFQKVILMGAGFSDSLLGAIWPKLDMEFETFQAISDQLRYSAHDCGARLQIRFLFETDWSKSFRDKSSKLKGVDTSNLAITLQATTSLFDGQFLYLVNRDVERFAQSQLNEQGGIQLPNAPWGLNMFQHIHNAVILSALNPTPAHIGFLTEAGLNADAIRDALFHSQIYQAVMRCSLRNPAAVDPVQVLVPDRKSAEALAEVFPGSDVQKLPLDIVETPTMPTGRPKLAEPKSKSLSRSESRKRSSAMNKEIKRIQNGGAVDHKLLEKFESECRGDNRRLIQLRALAGQAAVPAGAAPINSSSKRTTS